VDALTLKLWVLGNIRRGNIIIEKLANDENCHYVDNESSFRLLNGSINTALYNKDGHYGLIQHI
jgi:hypothetical protein